MVGRGVLDGELVICYDGFVVDEEGDGSFASGGDGGGTGGSAKRNDGHFDRELLCEWNKIGQGQHCQYMQAAKQGPETDRRRKDKKVKGEKREGGKPIEKVPESWGKNYSNLNSLTQHYVCFCLQSNYSLPSSSSYLLLYALYSVLGTMQLFPAANKVDSSRERCASVLLLMSHPSALRIIRWLVINLEYGLITLYTVSDSVSSPYKGTIMSPAGLELTKIRSGINVR